MDGARFTHSVRPEGDIGTAEFGDGGGTSGGGETDDGDGSDDDAQSRATTDEDEDDGQEQDDDGDSGEGQSVDGTAGGSSDAGGIPISPAERGVLDKEYQAQLAARDAADDEFNQLGPDAGGRSPIDPISGGTATAGQSGGNAASADAPAQVEATEVHAPGGGLVDPEAEPSNTADPTLAFSGPQYVDPTAAAAAGVVESVDQTASLPTPLPRPAGDATVGGGQPDSTLESGDAMTDRGVLPTPLPRPADALEDRGTLPTPLPEPADELEARGNLPIPVPAPADALEERGTLPTPLPEPAEALEDRGVLPVPPPGPVSEESEANDFDDDLVLADLSPADTIHEQLAATTATGVDVADFDGDLDIDEPDVDSV